MAGSVNKVILVGNLGKDPEVRHTQDGKAIVNLLQLGADEQITAFLPVARFEEGRHVFFATQRGTVKKTELMAYSNRRAAGIVAIGFVVSFITAMIVVKAFLGYVTRHGFTLFAWWRVIVGTVGLIALALGW